MSIRCEQIIKKILMTGFFLNKQKPFLSLVFNQSSSLLLQKTGAKA